MRCGFDPGEVDFRPPFVGVNGVWMDFWNGGGALSSSGAVERPPPVCWSRVSLALRVAQPINDKPM